MESSRWIKKYQAAREEKTDGQMSEEEGWRDADSEMEMTRDK